MSYLINQRSGRTQIIQEQKDLPENIEIIGKMAAAGITSLGVATASLAIGDQNLKKAYETVMTPAKTFDFVQKHPEAAAVINQFIQGDYEGILRTKNSLNLLVQALGQDVDVLTTSITSFLGMKGAFDRQTNTVVLDVTNGSRSELVNTFGHEIAHGQGIQNETSADLVGKSIDWAFNSGIKNNKDRVDQYKVQLGDGKDLITQTQNQEILKKDNEQFIKALSDHPDAIDEKTSYKQSIANSLFCWNKECSEKFKQLDKVQEIAYRKGQDQAVAKFISDIKNIPNLPNDVYEAVKNDPKGTAIAILKGIAGIPEELWDTGKTITKVNLVGDKTSDFEKLGNAEMTTALYALSGAVTAGTVILVKKGATITVEAVKNVKNSYILAKTPEGINFKITQPTHLGAVETFTQGSGIKGGHNSEAFYYSAQQNNVKILSKNSTGIKGIDEITYQIPSVDPAGNITGYKKKQFTKTVYDPNVFTDTKILKLGQIAASNGYKTATQNGVREYTSTAGGIKFQIYLDQNTGTVTNFFPIGKP